MNPSELKDAIALGLGFTTGFKRGMTSEPGREICASANASGGIILLDVTDADDLIGVADHNRLSPEVQTRRTPPIRRSPLMSRALATYASSMCQTRMVGRIRLTAASTFETGRPTTNSLATKSETSSSRKV